MAMVLPQKSQRYPLALAGAGYGETACYGYVS